MNYKTILVNDNPPICTITLNRPERRNAMTQEMQTELISALEETAASESRILILTARARPSVRDSICRSCKR